jgi:hypothetical protein
MFARVFVGVCACVCGDDLVLGFALCGLVIVFEVMMFS